MDDKRKKRAPTVAEILAEGHTPSVEEILASSEPEAPLDPNVTLRNLGFAPDLPDDPQDKRTKWEKVKGVAKAVGSHIGDVVSGALVDPVAGSEFSGRVPRYRDPQTRQQELQSKRDFLRKGAEFTAMAATAPVGPEIAALSKMGRVTNVLGQGLKAGGLNAAAAAATGLATGDEQGDNRLGTAFQQGKDAFLPGFVLGGGLGVAGQVLRRGPKPVRATQAYDAPAGPRQALPSGQYEVGPATSSPLEYTPEQAQVRGLLEAPKPEIPPSLPARPMPGETELTVEQILRRIDDAAAKAPTPDPGEIVVPPVPTARSRQQETAYRLQQKALEARLARQAELQAKREASNRAIPVVNSDATTALEAAKGVGARQRSLDDPMGLRLYDIGGAAGDALQQAGRFARTPAGQNTIGLGTGAYMSQAEDEKLAATGRGILTLMAAHMAGPRMGEIAGKVGENAVERMAGSPAGRKALNFISHDILVDPNVKRVMESYDKEVALWRAKAQELAGQAQRLGPDADRRIADLIEREGVAPLTPDEKVTIAVAQRIADEFRTLGQRKVDLNIMSPLTFAKREGEYLPRMYAEHLGDAAIAGKSAVDGQRAIRVGPTKVREELPMVARDRLGEIREASYRTAYGLDKGGRDVAAAKLFADLSEMPGVLHPAYEAAVKDLKAALVSGDDAAIQAARVKVSGTAQQLAHEPGYTRLADNRTFGLMQGAVVRDEVASYINGIPDLAGKTGALMRAWKKIHTIYNPGTHVGNTMSNSVIAHMSGLSVPEQFKALWNARKDMKAYGPSTQYLAERGVLERGLPTYAEGAVPVGGKPLKTALRELAGTTRPETRAVLAKKGLEPMGRVERGLRWADKKATDLYSREDGVFRVAVFDKLVKNGMPMEDAAKYVDEAFVNYKTSSPALKAIKDWYSPFVMYPAKAIPFVAKQIVEHPYRWMSLAAIWGGVDQFSRRTVGAIPESDLRPDQRTNPYLGYLSPGMTQLPIKGDNGEKFALNVERFTPFSALTGAPAPGSVAFALGGGGVPGILQPSGPLFDIAARAANTDPFTGDKIITDSERQTVGGAAKLATSMGKVALPSALSFHAPRIAEDVQNKNTLAAKVDALGLIGARPTVIKPGEQDIRNKYGYDNAKADVMEQMRRKLRKAEGAPDRQREIQADAIRRLEELADQYTRDYDRTHKRNPGDRDPEANPTR